MKIKYIVEEKVELISWKTVLLGKKYQVKTQELFLMDDADILSVILLSFLNV